MLKKTLCVALSVLMCFTLFVSAFAAENGEEQQKLVVFVEGIAARSILATETNASVFPPEASSIVSTVTKVLPDITQAVLKRDNSIMKEPFLNAVNEIFMPAGCDENGVPSPDTYFDYEWPTDEEILAAYQSDYSRTRVTYCYDWRLDMKTISKGLHDFIEHVIEVTGVESVSLVGFSMGTCAVLSYLKMYDYQYVSDVVLLAGAYAGVSCCGEPFAGDIKLDSEALVRYIDGMMEGNESLINVLVRALMHALYQNGAVDGIINWASKLIFDMKDAVYQEVFTKTFALMPGMWALIAPEDFEAAMALLGQDFNSTIKEKIYWYHDEVQAHTTDIIDGCFAKGINFGIVAKYGYGVAPVIGDMNVMTDSVIDTKYESFGATCADVGTTLGEDYVQKVNNGHDCISPDNMIDSSTCRYCDYTWFIKNISHSKEYGASMDVCRNIIDADKQLTVWDEESAYPQFLIYDGKKVVPLTKENNIVAYTESPAEETFFEAFKSFIKDFMAYIKFTLEQFKQNLTGKIKKVTNPEIKLGEWLSGLKGKVQC